MESRRGTDVRLYARTSRREETCRSNHPALPPRTSSTRPGAISGERTWAVAEPTHRDSRRARGWYRVPRRTRHDRDEGERSANVHRIHFRHHGTQAGRRRSEATERRVGAAGVEANATVGVRKQGTRSIQLLSVPRFARSLASYQWLRRDSREHFRWQPGRGESRVSGHDCGIRAPDGQTHRRPARLFPHGPHGVAACSG